ncbi:unnamed protein product [Phytophthora lilii]|uniref:Serine racemase n=1 Tax=Phytophthora lilii TaxID=2077276 RepID=A0A9W6YDQ3_9STRA|nr:unnamed protein product [Phytophthora lilii]
MVSGPISSPSAPERLVKRSVEVSRELLLGSFEQKDTCVIVLSDGEELHIPQRLLGSDFKDLLSSSKQIELTTRALCNLVRLICLCKFLVDGADKLCVLISSVSGSQGQKHLSPVMSPIGGSRKSVAALGHEYLFYLTVDKIEVIEANQDKEPALSDTASPVSDANVDASEETAPTESQAISGGPIAFSPRFIAGEKGDVEKGRARYLRTLEWRKENDIDNILVTPHPNFEIIKKYYPQYFHGRTRDGLPVYYERPGKIDLPALKREGLSIDDLLRHYMYITEYLWRVVEPNDSGRSITVLDVTGIGMYDLGGEVLDFIKRASAFTGAHYPERSAHIFIINIPGWFNMIWRMVKPLIDPVTREKVRPHWSIELIAALELCEYSPLLSQRVGYELFLKKDHRQMTGSFKERGARNALLQLTEEEKKNGVVAASAGNHAQALAYHGQLLGIPVTCVMPKVAPITKIMRCKELGARVVLHGEHILEARDKAEDFVRDEVRTNWLWL